LHWNNPAVEYPSLSQQDIADQFNDKLNTQGDEPLSTQNDSDFTNLSGKVCSPLIHFSLSALQFSSSLGYGVGDWGCGVWDAVD
jgi:hypothetical protein